MREKIFIVKSHRDFAKAQGEDMSQAWQQGYLYR